MNVSDYIANPCIASSLPFWKTETVVVPDNIRVVLDDDFDKDLYMDFADDRYFKLRHSLERIDKAAIPSGYHLEENALAKIAEHIGLCYDGAPSVDEILEYTKHPTFRPDFWVAIVSDSGQVVASGIAEIDARIGEGVLEWVQVSKDYRRKGLGKLVVNELLARLKQEGASFVTVSGRVDNPANPLALYEACGFMDKAIWHVLRGGGRMSYKIEEYKNYCEEEILPLYIDAGWVNYTARPNMLRRAYENSLCTLVARADDKVVGVVRAVGDGASVLFVQDIIVHSAFQRKGIGSTLLKELLARFDGVYQIELATDNTEKTIAFYKSLGFMSGSEIGCEIMMKISRD